MVSSQQSRRRTYSFSIGPLFIVLVTWPWMNDLLRAWGYRPYRGWGIAIGLGLELSFVLIAWLIDRALAAGGVPKSVRSGLWLGAVLGPYLGLLTADQGASLAASQVAGIAATILGFAIGYTIDRVLTRTSR
jgi:hypothetical protein